MAGLRYVVFLSLFVTSCAQVGTISGGEKDTAAPQVITDKVNPPNESVNFTSRKVEIPFDEFFRLDNPAENIRIVPPHAKIKAQMKKKSLLLSWDDTLQDNTTYAIYINNAVKDISEGNDSIIQYVFSTGPTLDSLSYTIRVVDSWSNDPVQKCVVGLFHPTTNVVQNFTETDINGVATLSYIKAGDYTLFAFMDENKDLTVQPHEKIGFPLSKTLSIDSSFADTIPVRLFTPLSNAKIRTAVFNAPGMFLIGATRPIENEKVYIHRQLIPKERYRWIAKDSLQLFTPKPDSTIGEIIIESDLINDTATVRFRAQKTSPPITINAKNSNNIFAPSQPISFTVNDYVVSVDTALISLMNTKDSILIRAYSFDLLLNTFTINLDKTKLSEVAFTFEEGAIQTSNGSSAKQKITIQLNEARKYGQLNIDLTSYRDQVLLQPFHNGKAIKLFSVEDPSIPFTISEVEPGDYTFKVIRDLNNNGLWDVGDLDTRTQPERVDTYSTVTKLRANWDVDVILIPTE